MLTRNTRPQGIRSLVIAAIASPALLALGHYHVAQRELNGPTDYLTIRADSFEYVKMIEGDLGTARPPFKYRIFVPLVAKILPVPPIEVLLLGSFNR